MTAEVQTRAAEAVWDALEACGVNQVYGIPGAVTVRLYNALYERRDRFNIIAVRHEQTASGMADAYGRLTGKPAVHLGQGPFVATNGGEAIIEAYLSSSPMLIISDASISHFSQHGVYQSGTGDYGSYDLRDIMRSMTKYTAYATTPKEVVQGVQIAYKHAISGRPGPACVIVKDPSVLGPVDLKAAPAVYPTDRYLNVAKPVAPADAVQRAADLIRQAQRPVIIAGNGVHVSKAYAELQVLAEQIGAGVATSFHGKGAIPETHPMALGVMGIFPEPAANTLVAEADVLVVIGCHLGASDTANESLALIDPSKQKIVQIDIEPRNVGWTYPVDEGLVGDARLVVRQLLDALEQPARRLPIAERRAALARRKAELRYFQDPETGSNASPTRPERLIGEIDAVLAPDAIVALDAGNNRIWATHYYQTKQAGTMLLPGGTAGMGWGPSAILGAKAAYPDRQCVSISGDGGFALAIQALPTAVENGLPAVFVVLNDSGLGMVMRGQGERLIASQFGHTDYARVAEAFGCLGLRVETPEQLRPALQKALESKVPAVLDVVIDPRVDYLKLRSPLVGYQYRAI